MKNVVLNLPTLAFVVGTRAALAGGIALLFSERLPAARRHAIGRMLVAIGAATTIPAAISVFRNLQRPKASRTRSTVYRDKRLIGAARYPRKGDEDEI